MKNLFCIALCSLFLFSCQKNDGELIDGTNLQDLFGPFAVLVDIEPSQTTINFEAGETMFFSGELSKNTDWRITFVGQESGAIRTISGNSKVLSSQNAEWNGGANDFPSFNIEDVDVEITFPNESDAVSFEYVLTLNSLRQDEGDILSGFEDGAGLNWEFFNQTTVQGTFECGDGEAAVGDCYYKITGIVGWDWAKGSVMIKPDDGGTFGLQSNASNLFFNMAFKAVENVGPTNSFILFWFDEDENGDGIFDPATEDRITYEYWSENDEWDLISLNYADLQFDSEGNPKETNGNGLMEPSKLVAINVFYLANPENGLSTGLIDHLIFTTDEPYLP